MKIIFIESIMGTNAVAVSIYRNYCSIWLNLFASTLITQHAFISYLGDYQDFSMSFEL